MKIVAAVLVLTLLLAFVLWDLFQLKSAIGAPAREVILVVHPSLTQTAVHFENELARRGYKVVRRITEENAETALTALSSYPIPTILIAPQWLTAQVWASVRRQFSPRTLDLLGFSATADEMRALHFVSYKRYRINHPTYVLDLTNGARILQNRRIGWPPTDLARAARDLFRGLGIAQCTAPYQCLTLSPDEMPDRLNRLDEHAIAAYILEGPFCLRQAVRSARLGGDQFQLIGLAPPEISERMTQVSSGEGTPRAYVPFAEYHGKCRGQKDSTERPVWSVAQPAVQAAIAGSVSTELAAAVAEISVELLTRAGSTEWKSALRVVTDTLQSTFGFGQPALTVLERAFR